MTCKHVRISPEDVAELLRQHKERMATLPRCAAKCRMPVHTDEDGAVVSLFCYSHATRQPN